MNQNSQTRTGGGLSISASNLAFTLLLLTLLLTLGGCNLLNADKRNTIDDLQTQVSTVQEQVAATHITVADMQSERDAEAGVLQEQLESIDKRLARLPRVIAKICPEVPADAENCPTADTQVVIKDSGKMVVGEFRSEGWTEDEYLRAIRPLHHSLTRSGRSPASWLKWMERPEDGTPPKLLTVSSMKGREERVRRLAGRVLDPSEVVELRIEGTE